MQLVGSRGGIIQPEQLVQCILYAFNLGPGILIAEGGDGDVWPVREQVQVEKP